MYEPPRLASVNTINNVYGVGPACMGCAVAVVGVAVAVGAGIHSAVVTNVVVGINVAVVAFALVVPQSGYTPAGALDPRLPRRMATATV